MVSYILLQPDWMVQYRFVTPVWPLAAIAIVLSVAHIEPKVSARGRILATGLAALAVVSSLGTFWLSDREFRAAPTVGVCNVAQNTGYNFNGYADILGVREGTLLAVDGGGTSLTSRLRYIDLSGLADRRIARFWQTDDMSGLREYIFDNIHPTFIKLFHGWAQRDRLALMDDPRLARDYVLMFSGQAGGGEWVRRNAVSDGGSLAAARLWGRDTWNLVTERYPPGVAPVWWCGDVLRPTPFSAGSAARSPLTRR
jgi:hypothetical protein